MRAPLRSGAARSHRLTEQIVLTGSFSSWRICSTNFASVSNATSIASRVGPTEYQTTAVSAEDKGKTHAEKISAREKLTSTHTACVMVDVREIAFQSYSMYSRAMNVSRACFNRVISSRLDFATSVMSPAACR
jgi:hypothetical protein